MSTRYAKIQKVQAMTFHPDTQHSEWPFRIVAGSLAMAGVAILVVAHMIYGGI